MNIIDLNQDQELKLAIIENMRTYGGGFVKALAECIMRADAKNLGRIELAFPEYLQKYHPKMWGKI